MLYPVVIFYTIVIYGIYLFGVPILIFSIAGIIRTYKCLQNNVFSDDEDIKARNSSIIGFILVSYAFMSLYWKLVPIQWLFWLELSSWLTSIAWWGLAKYTNQNPYARDRNFINTTSYTIGSYDERVSKKLQQAAHLLSANKIKIKNTPNELTITYNWFKWRNLLLLPICLILQYILFLYISSINWKDLNTDISRFPWLTFTATIICWFLVIANFINRTIINFSNGMLTIKSKPLLWINDCTVAVNTIRDVYYTETIDEERDTAHYSVYANANKKVITFFKGLTEGELAIFLKEQIEDWLFYQNP